MTAEVGAVGICCELGCVCVFQLIGFLEKFIRKHSSPTHSPAPMRCCSHLEYVVCPLQWMSRAASPHFPQVGVRRVLWVGMFGAAQCHSKLLVPRICGFLFILSPVVYVLQKTPLLKTSDACRLRD